MSPKATFPKSTTVAYRENVNSHIRRIAGDVGEIDTHVTMLLGGLKPSFNRMHYLKQISLLVQALQRNVENAINANLKGSHARTFIPRRAAPPKKGHRKLSPPTR